MNSAPGKAPAGARGARSVRRQSVSRVSLRRGQRRRHEAGAGHGERLSRRHRTAGRRGHGCRRHAPRHEDGTRCRVPGGGSLRRRNTRGARPACRLRHREHRRARRRTGTAGSDSAGESPRVTRIEPRAARCARRRAVPIRDAVPPDFRSGRPGRGFPSLPGSAAHCPGRRPRTPGGGNCPPAHARLCGSTRYSTQFRTSTRRTSSFITSSSIPSSHAMSRRDGSWCRVSSLFT